MNLPTFFPNPSINLTLSIPSKVYHHPNFYNSISLGFLIEFWWGIMTLCTSLLLLSLSHYTDIFILYVFDKSLDGVTLVFDNIVPITYNLLTFFLSSIETILCDKFFIFRMGDEWDFRGVVLFITKAILYMNWDWRDYDRVLIGFSLLK